MASKIKGELSACQHILVDTEMKTGDVKYSFFKCQIWIQNYQREA